MATAPAGSSSLTSPRAKGKWRSKTSPGIRRRWTTGPCRAACGSGRACPNETRSGRGARPGRRRATRPPLPQFLTIPGPQCKRAGGPGSDVRRPTTVGARPSRSLRRAGISSPDIIGFVRQTITPRDLGTKSLPTPHSPLRDQLHRKDSADSCSSAIALENQPVPAPRDCDACTAASRLAFSCSIR